MAPARRPRKPVDWKAIRPLYEKGSQTVQQIADAFDVSASVVSNHARKNLWHMRSNKISRAGGAKPRSRQGKRNHAPISRHDLVMRMYRVVEAQITEMERKLMQSDDLDGGTHLADEKEARLLGTLARTLEKLIDLENASQTVKKPKEKKDLDELKLALAERMEKFRP